MATKEDGSDFSETERAALHSLAEMFQDKEDRDQLRVLMLEGVTINKLVSAYKTQRGMITLLKATAGIIILTGGTVAAAKSLGVWPGK